ncbi:MAG: hypothetical protein M0017_06250 [Desulfobacteraceae bacterium]|nr:hypothetical protein [Desulfobacteraceae bacterium]
MTRIPAALQDLVVAAGAGRWSGVDETVVERIAGEHGRQALEPWLFSPRGDLLLFFFLVGGAVAGFIAGYCWRKLTERGKGKG